ncbi:MAG: glycosyltransferase [Methyloligellaceae bacterium]
MHSGSRLRILHCLRLPKGGVFRHVRDLVYEQTRLGYDVGVVCDSSVISPYIEDSLQKMEEACSLGIHRIPMIRLPSFKDFSIIRKTRQIAEKVDANIIHGHGPKGGAYARFAAGKLKRLGKRVPVFYTPHGGSIHFSNLSFNGFFYLSAERRLASMTQGIIFESAYSERMFRSKIMEPPCQTRVIPNGLHDHEFNEREHDIQAADFLFVGEMIKLKGADLFLDALSKVTVQTPVRAVMVGDGPERPALEKQAAKLGISGQVEFTGILPSQEAFKKARCLVLPSRSESLPYILMEAAAAEMPFIATDVGGIPELVEGTSKELVPANNVKALLAQMEDYLVDPIPSEVMAELFAEKISTRYSVERMTDEIMEMYYTHS